jgi:preprotein translocase subunit SecD
MTELRSRGHLHLTLLVGAVALVFVAVVVASLLSTRSDPPPLAVLDFRWVETGTGPMEPEELESIVTVMSERLARLVEDRSVELIDGPLIRVTVPEEERERVKRILTTRAGGELELRIVAEDGDPVAGGGTLELAREREIFEEAKGDDGLESGDPDYPSYRWCEHREADGQGKPIRTLLRIDRWNFGAPDLEDLAVTRDVSGFGWVVRFGIVDAREAAFGAFTGANSAAERGEPGRALAIVLDGKIVSAPYLRDELRDGGIISGGGTAGFSKAEAEELLESLLAGSMSFGLELVSESSR